MLISERFVHLVMLGIGQSPRMYATGWRTRLVAVTGIGAVRYRRNDVYRWRIEPVL